MISKSLMIKVMKEKETVARNSSCVRTAHSHIAAHVVYNVRSVDGVDDLPRIDICIADLSLAVFPRTTAG